MTFIARRVGPHEISALLGKGGMDEFLQNPRRVGRFRREAEALASLNHPNVAAIYELCEADGNQVLILEEMVESQTLADRGSKVVFTQPPRIVSAIVVRSLDSISMVSDFF